MNYMQGGAYGEGRGILQDYLDIKFTSEKRVQDHIISHLIRDSESSNYAVELADAIIFGKTLIYIQDERAENLKNVMVLNKKNQKVHYLKEMIHECLLND